MIRVKQFVIISIVLLSGCSPLDQRTKAPKCSDNSQCWSTELCFEGVCRQVCSESDTSCFFGTDACQEIGEDIPLSGEIEGHLSQAVISELNDSSVSFLCLPDESSPDTHTGDTVSDETEDSVEELDIDAPRDDGTDSEVPVNCVDNDADERYAVSEECPTGNDHCDNDPDNWSQNGCQNCNDLDGDGYGQNCDRGSDCDENDSGVWNDCPGCLDEDGDNHFAVSEDCEAGDDNCDESELPHHDYNWTVDGCSECLDEDEDEFGENCDLGEDCNDNDELYQESCPGCVDSDGDGHDHYDPTYCQDSDDYCDTNERAWTQTGCTECIDSDGDGFGDHCDLGQDCDDENEQYTNDCPGCEDSDSDGHFDITDESSDYCPQATDNCPSNPDNWTEQGCGSCVDGDSDGFGDSCDKGPDCEDDNPELHSECCYDADSDQHLEYDETFCIGGTDFCGSDEHNHTQSGCENCVDNDGDGRGQNCDRGSDCEDRDPDYYQGCPTCQDLDGDSHQGVVQYYCEEGTDHCDTDEHNNTQNGCQNCVDNDNDGYGANCDKGIDCEDGNPEMNPEADEQCDREDWNCDGSDFDFDEMDDYDDDGDPDCIDEDDDDDGVDDEDDSHDNNENRCRDTDNDGCDDCSSGSDDTSNDGDDEDGDGICDNGDNCPEDSNSNQANTDGDDHGNVCDNCPDDSNDNQANFDEELPGGDELGDTCDLDDDADGYEELADNDCDDLNPDKHPNAPEISNGEDDNCNSHWFDEVLAHDKDGDGYTADHGNPYDNRADCDDEDIFVNPWLGGGGCTISASELTVGAACDYSNIDDAIDAASTGDILKVAGGVYTDSVAIDKNIRIYGGYDESCNSRNKSQYTTKITGEVSIDAEVIAHIDGVNIDRSSSSGVAVANAGKLYISDSTIIGGAVGISNLNQLVVATSKIFGISGSFKGISSNAPDDYPVVAVYRTLIDSPDIAIEITSGGLAMGSSIIIGDVDGSDASTFLIANNTIEGGLSEPSSNKTLLNNIRFNKGSWPDELMKSSRLIAHLEPFASSYIDSGTDLPADSLLAGMIKHDFDGDDRVYDDPFTSGSGIDEGADEFPETTRITSGSINVSSSGYVLVQTSADYPQITIDSSGVILLGGYTSGSDFGSRDDIDVSGTEIRSNNDEPAIQISASDVFIEGFVISGDDGSAVEVDSGTNIWLERNYINGGVAPSNTYGVEMNSGVELLLINNHIYGGTSESESSGVLAQGDLVAINNTINGGVNNSSDTHCIKTSDVDAEIFAINNFIESTSGGFGNRLGFYLHDSNSVYILNNNFDDSVGTCHITDNHEPTPSCINSVDSCDNGDTYPYCVESDGNQSGSFIDLGINPAQQGYPVWFDYDGDRRSDGSWDIGMDEQ